MAKRRKPRGDRPAGGGKPAAPAVAAPSRTGPETAAVPAAAASAGASTQPPEEKATAAASAGASTGPSEAKAAARPPAGRQAADSPRFPLEISAAKLALARFVIFTVVAVDAVLQIRHAGRYGAGDFNVPHLLGLPGPGREAYLFCQCAIAFLSMMVAVGVGGRLVPAAMSLLYGWCYFGSQLDSYQHHYLTWLLVTLWCFVPAPPTFGAARPPPAGTSPGPLSVRSSALRLILLQLGILYLWAGISKLDPKWLDGTALSMQIGGLLREIIDATVGIKIASRMVVVVELALAATIWRTQTWRWALPLGVGLHAGIAVSGLEIGVFAYLMIALYLLIVPEKLLTPLFDWLRDTARWPGRWLRRLHDPFEQGHRGVSAALLGVSVALFALLRPPLVGSLTCPLLLAFLAVPAVLTIRWRLGSVHRFTTRMALACALALVVLLTVDRVAAVSIDYYRHWGGAARRLGETAEAERAYRKLVELAPELGHAHFHLGRLLIRRGALDEGLARLREAERLEPTRTRALDEQVRALAAAGRQEEAREAAARARARRDTASPMEVIPDRQDVDESVETEPAR